MSQHEVEQVLPYTPEQEARPEWLTKLQGWGNEFAGYIDANGLIGEDGLAYIRNRLSPAQHHRLSELKEVLNGRVVHFYPMPNGYGHDRVAEDMALLVRLAGGEAIVHHFGADGEPDTPLLNEFVASNYYEYCVYWLNKKGYPELIPELTAPHNVFRIVNAIHALVNPKEHESFLSGNIEGATPEKILGQYNLMHFLFGAEMRRMIESMDPNAVHVSVHPMATPTLPPELPVIVIGTDSRLVKNWFFGNFNFFYRYFVETDEAKADLVNFWQETIDADSMITVTGGFPAPLASLDADRLAYERSVNDNPPIDVMLASGVSPLQLNVFLQSIREMAHDIASGKRHVFIQAGHGELGTITQRLLTEGIAALEKELGLTLSDGIIVHRAETVQGVIHAFDIVAWSQAPVILHVKGGEVARMAPMLALPLIPTGVAGVHEVYNLYFSIIAGMPVYFTPQVYAEFAKELKAILGEDGFEDFARRYMDGRLFGGLAQAMSAAESWVDLGVAPETKWETGMEILMDQPE